MSSKVHVQHTFASDPAEVFEALSEHENLSRVFAPAKVVRLRDGESSRNGVGSVRRLKIGPLASFEETVTASDPNERIEYRITKGTPLRNHLGVQSLTPNTDGGTLLDYTITFDAPLPGMGALVSKLLARSLRKGLPRLIA
jgi:uncharacterized protein YndB with AHSA1/START domain